MFTTEVRSDPTRSGSYALMRKKKKEMKKMSNELTRETSKLSSRLRSVR